MRESPGERGAAPVAGFCAGSAGDDNNNNIGGDCAVIGAGECADAPADRSAGRAPVQRTRSPSCAPALRRFRACKHLPASLCGASIENRIDTAPDVTLEGSELISLLALFSVDLSAGHAGRVHGPGDREQDAQAALEPQQLAQRRQRRHHGRGRGQRRHGRVCRGHGAHASLVQPALAALGR